MKKLFVVGAMCVAVFTGCKKEGESTTKVTTEEVTTTDTVGNETEVTTEVTRTVETDTTKATISSEAVEKQPVEIKKNTLH
ncbi:hypothetical protein VF13_42340 [Nostoc linckia z16]|nr:hypothetical protein VF13_42340 [Nostoc linckia z16]